MQLTSFLPYLMAQVQIYSLFSMLCFKYLTFYFPNFVKKLMNLYNYLRLFYKLINYLFHLSHLILSYSYLLLQNIVLNLILYFQGNLNIFSQLFIIQFKIQVMQLFLLFSLYRFYLQLELVLLFFILLAISLVQVSFLTSIK